MKYLGYSLIVLPVVVFCLVGLQPKAQAATFTCNKSDGSGTYQFSCNDCGGSTNVICPGGFTPILQDAPIASQPGYCYSVYFCADFQSQGQTIQSASCDGNGSGSCIYSGSSGACQFDTHTGGYNQTPPYLCGTGGGVTPDFSVALSPSTQSIGPGASTSYTVTVSTVGDYSGNVNLSYSNCPSGAICTLSPTTVNSGNSWTALLIITNTGGLSGSYNNINVTGTDGTLTHLSNNVSLIVNTSAATCDGTWRPVTGFFRGLYQPVIQYMPASSNSGPPVPNSMMAVALGTDGKTTYYQTCSFASSNPCIWSNSWQPADDPYNATNPVLTLPTYTSPAYQSAGFTGIYELATDNTTVYSNYVFDSSLILGNLNWTNWNSSFTSANSVNWGKPFRGQDNSGNWWEIKNDGNTISYACKNTPVCEDLLYNPNTSGFSTGTTGATTQNISVAANSTFYAYCDYNAKVDSSAVYLANTSGITCSSSPAGRTRTAAYFSCTAPNTNGAYGFTCGTNTGTADNICAQTNFSGTVTVTGGATCPAATVGLSPSTVIIGGNATASISGNFTGGTFVSGTTGVATISGSGNSVTVHGASAGSSDISGSGWKYTPNGATNCFLSPATLTVNPPSPGVAIDPHNMSFTGISGQAAATPASRNLTITNSGPSGTTLKWIAKTNQDWCRVNGVNSLGKNSSGASVPFPTGSLGGGSAVVSITVDPPSNTGTYNCNVTVSDNGSSPAAAPASDVDAVVYNVSPSNPSGLTASAASCSVVNLSWTASAANGQPVTYTILKNTVNVLGSANTLVSGLSATSYSDTGLAGSTAYWYWIQATSNGLSSAQVQFPAVSTPACPVSVTGVCGTANGKSYAYGTAGYGSDTQCASGTTTNGAFPAPGNSLTWVCTGQNGGSNSGNCTANQQPNGPGPTCYMNALTSTCSGGSMPGCNSITLNWTDNSGGAAAFKIYKDGVLLTTTAVGATTYTFNPGDNNNHTYTIAATQNGIDSPTVNIGTVASISCASNMLDSTKTIETINGAAMPAHNLCGGTNSLPAGTVFNQNDVVTFSVNLCNDQGFSAATGITVTDTLVNLQKPSGGWSPKYNGSAVAYSGTCASATAVPAASGASGHYCDFDSSSAQMFTFHLNFNLSAAGSNIPARATKSITMQGQVGVPDTYSGSYPRFQNSFIANYNSGVARSQTPLLLFNIGSGKPTIIEIP